jgi:hypothetical protein
MRCICDAIDVKREQWRNQSLSCCVRLVHTCSYRYLPFL